MASLIAPSEARAFEVKSTEAGHLVHWERPAVEFVIAASVEANTAGAEEATRHAMESWSGTVGAPELSVDSPRGQAPSMPAVDFKNRIVHVPSGYEPAGRSLAITILTYDNTTGEIVDADIAFNGRYKFSVLADGTSPQAAPTGPHPTATDGIAHEEPSNREDAVYDLHHVVAHELGHALGMADELRRSDVLMYRYSAPNDATMRAPMADDIAGIEAIYGSRLEAAGSGCGGAMVTPKRPSQASGRTAMLAAAALLIFLMRRARTDRRARVAFVLAVAVSAGLLLPDVATETRRADASVLATGHARANVVAAVTEVKDGLFRTTYALRTTACRVARCPTAAEGSVWGGTLGTLRQEVGEHYAPVLGSEVEVTFGELPRALGAIRSPLGETTTPSRPSIAALSRIDRPTPRAEAPGHLREH